jgi:hypothetical protein
VRLLSQRATASASTLFSAAARPGCAVVKGNCELEAFLKKVAPGGEVLVAISNFNLIQRGGMLNTWIEAVQKTHVKPWMVLAIDRPLNSYLNERKVPNFLIEQEIATVQQGTGSNHAVSALKFGILAEFLKLGWSVLLSDVDIVTLSDPFQHLYRDRDIEGESAKFKYTASCPRPPARASVMSPAQPALEAHLPQDSATSVTAASRLGVPSP